MEAIVLVGGLGTRLRTCIKDVPKPMALVKEKPFLNIVLSQLTQSGFKKIVLAVGYKKEMIEDYYGIEFEGVPIIYSEESSPLLTGGAIKQASKLISAPCFFVLNGDTYNELDYRKLLREHISSGSDISISLKHVQDTSRYGSVKIKENFRITQFIEKGISKSGFINSGVYCLSKKITKILPDQPFSFEKFIQNNLSHIRLSGFPFEGIFIDIGIPEDYKLAQSIEFKS